MILLSSFLVYQIALLMIRTGSAVRRVIVLYSSSIEYPAQ